MANMPEVQIQIDQDALRAQIHEAIRQEFEWFSQRLRVAADELDGGKWWIEHQKWQRDEAEKEYKRGYEEGKVARDE